MEQIQVLYDATLGWLTAIVLETDPGATYANPAVQHLWQITLSIVDVLGVIFLILTGYQILFSAFSAQYAQILDLLPRVVFSLVAAHLSLLFAGLAIDFNNDICQEFLSQRDLLAFFAHTGGMGLFLLPFLLVMGILMFLLCLQMAMRIALLDFLTVILPFLLLLLSNRSTEHIGRAGLEAYASVIFIQSAQVLLLVLGENVIIPFFTGTIGPQSPLSPLTNLVVGIALFLLILQLPVILSRIILHPVAETGGAVRTLVTMAIARLI